MKSSFTNGERQGESVFYYLNGTIYSSGNYLDDNKEGSWEFYNQDGILDTLINYTNE
jgi:antitoxin component YwqK of YwqJK toxin-antitoxin module